ncbi:hypothetical protein [Methanotorris formicicus]|uniref:Uncharacterized protein n=1 Tax=Methanotorris formicicus Mc-S-70 TaxID=647171 RepID=H1KWR0_9EURY|nr:hypothetical protein [Methanotorris formicicus]EHP89175.1 hypothetical protein MetfoDRAFT_0233 [Methanotorris formicicus Mc-S-70]
MIEVIAYEELRGNKKGVVEEEFEEVVNELKEKYNAKLLSVEEEEGNLYTKVGELEIKFNSFLDYIDFCLKYGADVEVISPSKLKMDSKEFGNTIAHIIQFFSNFCKKYNVAFNAFVREGKDIDIDKYREGIYDEDDIHELQEDGYLRIKVVFEVEGKSEEVVIKNIIQSLDENIHINKIITKALDDKEGFHGLIAVDMLCKPFEIVEIAYKFLPVAVSIGGNNIELDISELQDIGNELSGAIFELSHAAKIKRGGTNASSIKVYENR